MLVRKQGEVPMRPIICDCCQIRIDDSWNGPAIEVKVHNGVDSDVAGDYCVDCAGDISAAIRSVIEDNKTDSTNE
jgi:hypothetical protein